MRPEVYVTGADMRNHMDPEQHLDRCDLTPETRSDWYRGSVDGRRVASLLPWYGDAPEPDEREPRAYRIAFRLAAEEVAADIADGAMRHRW